MKRDLFCALSVSALLLACAHDKTSRAESRPASEARAEAEHDQHEQQVAEANRERAREEVEVPQTDPRDRERMAASGGELPARGDTREPELTALDQGNSEIDLDLTQRIRKAVVADDALSFTAKNVKIITRDGHVTLRGRVKTPEEKQSIWKCAVAEAGAAHVTNQLEVSP